MTPQIATVLCVLAMLALYHLDRGEGERTSQALWLPVVWVSITASRMLSEWLAIVGFTYGTTSADLSDRLLEGSPLDRLLLTALVAFSVIVLLNRGRKVGTILRANAPIVIFILYCAVSVLWSDFPAVSFKRWIKSAGDVAMVLIVLTDPNPSAAVKRLLVRVGFLLVPASVLVNKYYPELGRQWSPWGGASFTGVTTGKNELGGICLLFGLGFMWRFLQGLRCAGGTRRTGLLIAHSALLAMVIWLFWKANTVTALSCFVMGSVLILMTGSSLVARRLWIVHLLVLAMLSVSLSALFLDAGAGVVQTLGRDPSLTGRTPLWNLVLSMTGNQLLGTGFESFWLGPRLDHIWSVYWWHPNEAHNGYIEVFLNLGWVGVALLGLLIVTGYRNVVAAIRRDPENGKLRLAYFVAALAYNITESAIRIMHPIWILFLLATMAVPGGWAVASPTGLSQETSASHSLQDVPLLTEV